LFRGAIAESGAYVEFQDYFDFIVPLATGETMDSYGVPSGEAIASAWAAKPEARLPSVRHPPLALTEPGTVYPFVDGTVLTQTPVAAFASGQFNQVPVISGAITTNGGSI